MKTIGNYLLFIFAVLFSSQLYAEGVKFETIPWEKAIQKAQDKNKLIFVDAYTDWCGWCEVMEEKTFSNSVISDFMEKHFFSLRYDMEQGEGKRLAMKYSISSFPTFLIFDKDGKLVYKTSGFSPPKDFIIILEEAIDPESWESAPGISNDLELPYPDFYKAAFAKSGTDERKFPDSSTVHEYLQKNTDWFDELNWLVIKRFKTNKKVNDFFLENMEKYGELYFSADVRSKMYHILYQMLIEAVEMESEEKLDEILSLINKHDKERKEQNIIFYQSRFYEYTENWSGLSKKIEEYIEKNGYENTRRINEDCWKLYENTEDPEIIAKAAYWMEEVTKIDPQWAYLDTYAALLYKKGDFEKAKVAALQAIKKGKEEDKTRVSETEELLRKIEDKLK